MAEGPVACLSEHPGGSPVRRQTARVPRFRGQEQKTRQLRLQLHMQVEVETYAEEGGAEQLRRFRLDSQVIEVANNIGQWQGTGYQPRESQRL